MASKNKTKETDASVASYFEAIADPARRADCEALADLLAKTTKQPATMWGTAIVGFGRPEATGVAQRGAREGQARLSTTR